MVDFDTYKSFVKEIEKKYAEYAFKSTDVKFLDNTTFDDYYSCIFNSDDMFNKERNKYRTPFQIERDRILYSPLFNRLLYKTQLFTSERIGFTESRLTHTLKVMQIGRSICRGLKLNEDLVEAIALGHDIGHPPFAHIGEEALNEWALDKLSSNVQSLIPTHKKILGQIDPKSQGKVQRYFSLSNDPKEDLFMHGRQSFRLLVLKRKEEKREHLRFTRPVMYGIWRHSVINFSTDKDFEFKMKTGNKTIELTGKYDLTLETQVVRYADDIAWVISDLEEGINNKLLTVKNDIQPIIDSIDDSTLAARLSHIFGNTPPKTIELFTIFISDLITTNLEKLKKCNNPINFEINFSSVKSTLFNRLRSVIKEKLHNKYFMARGSQVNKARIKALCEWYFNYPDDLLLEINTMMEDPKFPIHLQILDYKKEKVYSEFELYKNLIKKDKVYRIATIIDFVSVLTDQEVYWLSETVPIGKY